MPDSWWQPTVASAYGAVVESSISASSQPAGSLSRPGSIPRVVRPSAPGPTGPTPRWPGAYIRILAQSADPHVGRVDRSKPHPVRVAGPLRCSWSSARTMFAWVRIHSAVGRGGSRWSRSDRVLDRPLLVSFQSSHSPPWGSVARTRFSGPGMSLVVPSHASLVLSGRVGGPLPFATTRAGSSRRRIARRRLAGVSPSGLSPRNE